jgi:hypothetical protein
MVNLAVDLFMEGAHSVISNFGSHAHSGRRPDISAMRAEPCPSLVNAPAISPLVHYCADKFEVVLEERRLV